MKSTTPFFVKTALILGCLFFQFQSNADNTRVTNPTALSFELGGRGLLYTFNLDRALSDDLSVGVGIGGVPVNNPDGSSANINASLIPVYLTYYLARDAGSLFLTGGADWVTNASPVASLSSSVGTLQFSSSQLLVTFGIGYEYRSDAGYLVRATGYGIYGNSLTPWGGITFGYSF